jgi:anthranilate/para-aminobenzoate synthase component II
MNLSELQELKTKIQANHDAVVMAIDQFMAKERHYIKKPTVVIPPAPRKETMSKSVEKIIKSFSGDFEIYDIFCKYEETIGSASGSGTAVRREIGNVINKLRQRKPAEIEVVRSGKGNRSGCYRTKA